MDVDHLNCGELFENGAWGQAAGAALEAGFESDLQAISQERDKDVGFDALLELVVNAYAVDAPSVIFS